MFISRVLWYYLILFLSKIWVLTSYLPLFPCKRGKQNLEIISTLQDKLQLWNDDISFNVTLGVRDKTNHCHLKLKIIIAFCSLRRENGIVAIRHFLQFVGPYTIVQYLLFHSLPQLQNGGMIAKKDCTNQRCLN